MSQENAMDNAAITAQEERSLLKQKVRGVQSSDFQKEAAVQTDLRPFKWHSLW